jgi:hypothetical protein
MSVKRPSLPPRQTAVHLEENASAPSRSRRLYERYDFVAEASVTVSDDEIASSVRNISLGGCLVQTTKPMRVGAELTIKIDKERDHFEASATVVHSLGNNAGLMFGRFEGNSLFVLGKWVAEAKSVLEGNPHG